MHKFWLCFFAIFMAVNAMGVLPRFTSFTWGLDHLKIKRKDIVL
jgi:hypothetical protein